MRVNIYSKDELKERLRVYRPMQLYMSADPAPLQFCRCAPIFVVWDSEDECWVICWYHDGHCVECYIDKTIQLVLTKETRYGNDVASKFCWSDKYSLDEIVEEHIQFARID